MALTLAMAYIVTRKIRFYVVVTTASIRAPAKIDADGNWWACSLADAEAIAESLTEAPGSAISLGRAAVTLSDYYRTVATQTRTLAFGPQPPTATAGSSTTTSTRLLATSRCARFDPNTSTTCTCHSLAGGGRNGDGLAPKTVHEVHVIIRSALNDAIDCGLLRNNAAAKARSPRPDSRRRTGTSVWDAIQLAEFLEPPVAIVSI